MNICYSNPGLNPIHLFTSPFVAAKKHFRLVFATSSAYEPLQKNKVADILSLPSVSLTGRVYHLFVGTLELIPLAGAVVYLVDYFFNASSASAIPEGVQNALLSTPPFQGYTFEGSTATLSSLSERPANLFYDAVTSTPHTKPNSGELFRFKNLSAVWRSIYRYTFDSSVLSFSAVGKKVRQFDAPSKGGNCDLEEFLGNATCRFSGKEIKEIVGSQKVYLSSLIPKTFYLYLKRALKKDELTILPGSDHSPLLLKEVDAKKHPYLASFLKKVENHPSGYGFEENGTMLTFNELKELSLYQVGAMVLKAETYYTLVENGYKLKGRQVGDRDALRLISASAIRGFRTTHTIPGNKEHQIDSKIMKHTFANVLRAAGKEAFLVMPAIGMGVWGGDPNLYWRAFLDAVVESEVELEGIFVNPGHQKTPIGSYKGCSGEEFSSILNQYLRRHPRNYNLNKILNLYHRKSDLLLFANNLKKEFPDKTVAIVNASDPDVTLADHVGEYVNNPCHPPTTEENFTAAGTNGLGFEEITGVLNDPKNRVLSFT
jgi:hypothetical protein